MSGTMTSMVARERGRGTPGVDARHRTAGLAQGGTTEHNSGIVQRAWRKVGRRNAISTALACLTSPPCPAPCGTPAPTRSPTTPSRTTPTAHPARAIHTVSTSQPPQYSRECYPRYRPELEEGELADGSHWREERRAEDTRDRKEEPHFRPVTKTHAFRWNGPDPGLRLALSTGRTRQHTGWHLSKPSLRSRRSPSSSPLSLSHSTRTPSRPKSCTRLLTSIHPRRRCPKSTYSTRCGSTRP